MRAYKLARAASRAAVVQPAHQHVSYNSYSAAAPARVQQSDVAEQSQLSAAHERRLQEMYRASANAEPMVQQAEQRQYNLPSAAEVADRLNSSRGASCSSSTAADDSNSGLDWREALALLQARDRQHLQQSMLTDTFR